MEPIFFWMPNWYSLLIFPIWLLMFGSLVIGGMLHRRGNEKLSNRLGCAFGLGLLAGVFYFTGIFGLWIRWLVEHQCP